MFVNAESHGWSQREKEMSAELLVTQGTFVSCVLSKFRDHHGRGPKDGKSQRSGNTEV